ncbi:MAG: DNA adenine methylase [Caldilineaceae bacterium]|nr:DNA adenine methylase [Caldilineaceae bacterium]
MTQSTPGTVQYEAKPFLKWAGGKSQLLRQLSSFYPAELAAGRIHRYVEPFLGGGAVFLDIAQRFDVAQVYLFDINEEIILAYTVVKQDPQALIELLAEHREQYTMLTEDARAGYYYAIRERYNAHRRRLDFKAYSDAWVERAADMIFLNKTCFNGLYRVNSRGFFNVPFGRYKKPVIFEEQNIWRISELLQRATLAVGAFDSCAAVVDDRTFVYFDPPYRPISTTSSFTSYARHRFDDDDQRALGAFFRKLAKSTAAKLMLSNSDPKNLDPDDDFFDRLYAGFHIQRVYANRMINSKADSRGKITEILVTNY